METYYQKQLNVAQQQYDLATLGCLAQAKEIIVKANIYASSEGGLTLEYVCELADELNHMLEAVCKLKDNIAETERIAKKLEAQEAEVKDA